MILFGISLIIFSIIIVCKNEELDSDTEENKPKIKRNLIIAGILFISGLIIAIVNTNVDSIKNKQQEKNIKENKQNKSIEDRMKEDIKKYGHYIDNLYK